MSTSIPFVLNAAAVSGARATAAGSLALAASAVSSAVIKPVLVTSVAFDGQGKAGATPAASFDDQFAILGTAAALSVSSAVFAEHFEAAVASSAALFTRANANGSIQIAGPIRTTADVAARAESQILPRGSSVGGASCRISASGVMSFGATSSGGVSSTSTAAGTFVALTQSEAGVPVDVLSSRAIDLTGSVVGRVANAAGIAGSVASGGSTVSVTHSDAAAQSVLGLQGHSRCALASSARTEGHLRVVSIIHAEASGAGSAAGEIGISGFAATLAAVAVAFDATVTPAGVASTTIAGTAAGQSETTIQQVARVDTGAASSAQSDFAISGLAFGVSLPPLFAQAASPFLLGGFATSYAKGVCGAELTVGFESLASGMSPVMITVQGGFDVDGPSAAELETLGQYDRVIPISGAAASASAVGASTDGVVVIDALAIALATRAVVVTGELALWGAAHMQAPVLGVSTSASTIGWALTSTAAILVPAAAGSDVPVSGNASAKAQAKGSAFAVAPLAGSSRGLLTISGRRCTISRCTAWLPVSVA